MNAQSLTRADLCAKLVDLLTELRHSLAIRRNKAGTSNPRISSALRKLCAGAITVEDYLRIKLERALEPLEQLLRREDVDAVRLTMLERIRTEPIWRSVVEELRAKVARGRRSRHDR